MYTQPAPSRVFGLGYVMLIVFCFGYLLVCTMHVQNVTFAICFKGTQRYKVLFISYYSIGAYTFGNMQDSDTSLRAAENRFNCRPAAPSKIPFYVVTS